MLFIFNSFRTAIKQKAGDALVTVFLRD